MTLTVMLVVTDQRRGGLQRGSISGMERSPAEASRASWASSQGPVTKVKQLGMHL